MTNTPTKQRIRQILNLLKGEYGIPKWQGRHDPLSVLVQTILSQNTSDTNSRGAFLALLNAFDNWQDVADADIGTIAYCIRSGGLGRIKAQRIKQALGEENRAMVQDFEIYKWMQEQFGSFGRLSKRKLESRFGSEDVQRALLVLNYLRAHGFVDRRPSRGDTEFIALDTTKVVHLISQPESFQSAKVSGIQRSSALAETPRDIEEHPSRGQYEPSSEQEVIVISYPPSIAEAIRNIVDSYPDIEVTDFKDILKSLLASADREVLVAAPFLELDGLVYLVDEIFGLAKRGVALKVLTRELLFPSVVGATHAQKMRAFSKLYDIYGASGASYELVEIRDFTVRIGKRRGEGYHYEGIHQKLLIVDGKAAYVGSADIRSASFIANGDAGIVHIGKRALFWKDFFNAFWRQATEVPHAFLTERLDRHSESKS